MIARRGFAFTELLGALVGIALFGALAVAALGGERQRLRIETASARFEEAQNLLAAWRAGETLQTPGWSCEVQTVEAGEILVLHAPGLRLSTIRPRPGGGR